ncbi:precorrin-3B synthase [Streptomyces finlayi]|uniref:Precorrin-3B synthase n=1 Tax=Streptomyces finlayi TaxID=67296 RepID=A0A7G7BL34_9ACTN|nr:precorrin-3B synthase [Streptomyces finlayi]QNE76049.1 precorrin-3B synthase [Streptomyces finlayi]
MLAAMSASALSPRSQGAACARSSGDACPGTLRLHRADDGALARVRIPGGVLTTAQAQALDEAARQLGDGDVHLTSRGNAQLRGLSPDCGPELAGLLAAAGLLPSERHERVRNIVASPLSGLDDRALPDIRPWLTGLDRLLCRSESATALSGRFLFALDDGRGDVDALGADVTLIAEGATAATALLRTGDCDTVLRIPDADAPRAALLAAEVFLDAARPSGAWRVKDLPDDIRAALPARVARQLTSTTPTAAPRPKRATPPPPGPVPAGHRPTVALAADVPLGRLAPVQWRLLTETARRCGGELRLTPWRGVVVPGAPPDRADDLLAALDAAGLITGPASPWAGVGACIGRPGCARSLADVRAEAAATVGPPGRPGQLPVHWSGCERRCGHPHGEWVDVVATPDGGHRITVVRDGAGPQDPVTVPPGTGALATAVATARDTTP